MDIRRLVRLSVVVLALLLTPLHLQAQPLVATPVTAISPVQQSSHTTVAFTPAGTNRMLVACVTNETSGGGTPDTISVSFNTSEAFTEVAQVDTMGLWVLVNPTSTNAAVTYLTSEVTTSIISVLPLSNAAQIVPGLSNTDICPSPCVPDQVSAALTTTVANTLLITCAYSNRGNHFHDHGVGQFEQTEVNNPNDSGLTQSVSTEVKAAPGLETLTTSASPDVNFMRYAVTGVAPAVVTQARRGISPWFFQ